MQFIEEKTNGRLSLGAATLYGALTSLQKKEYLITSQNKLIAEKELCRLNELVGIAAKIVGGTL